MRALDFITEAVQCCQYGMYGSAISSINGLVETTSEEEISEIDFRYSPNGDSEDTIFVVAALQESGELLELLIDTYKKYKIEAEKDYNFKISMKYALCDMLKSAYEVNVKLSNDVNMILFKEMVHFYEDLKYLSSDYDVILSELASEVEKNNPNDNEAKNLIEKFREIKEADLPVPNHDQDVSLQSAGDSDHELDDKFQTLVVNPIRNSEIPEVVSLRSLGVSSVKERPISESRESGEFSNPSGSQISARTALAWSSSVYGQGLDEDEGPMHQTDETKIVGNVDHQFGSPYDDPDNLL